MLRIRCNKKTLYKYATLARDGKLSFGSEAYTSFAGKKQAEQAIINTCKNSIIFKVEDFVIEEDTGQGETI